MTAPLSRFPLVQLRHLSAVPITNGLGEAGDPANDAAWPRYIRTTDIVAVRALDQNKRVTLSPAIADQARVLRGDILMTSAGATVGKSYLHLTDETACFAGYLSRLRVRSDRALPEFVAYWTESSHYTDQVQSGAVKSTIENFSAAKYRAMRMPVPPLQKQRAIVDYLDRETAQIDAFIAKNEELITLLTERRSAVATQAVTRGIDDCATLKDSGFGWLGSIPEGWEAVRVKFAVESLPGFAFASGDFVDDNEATRLLRGVNVGVGTVSWGDSVAIMNAPAEVQKRYMLEEGDLVLGLDRPVISGGLRVARICQGDAGALLVQRVLRLRGTRVRNDYLEYALTFGGFAMYIEPDFTGVSVPHMSEQQVGDFRIALPSLPVQERITTHIRERHAVIDAALDTARRSIDLMRERRNALISAAVTGKVDVGVGA